jgi:hypothetical protein
VSEGFTGESFMFPTTIAKTDGRLLAVNAWFDRRESGDPELPFSIVSVPFPN